MEDIRVDTAQNVAVDYKIASIWDRIAAITIDFLIQLIIFGTGTIIITNLVSGEKAILISIGVVFVPVIFYHFICETTMNGQSFGKKVMMIKVIKKDGSQPTIGAYFLRWIMRLIEVDMMSGSLALATILINGKGQRLGDMAAGTTVVKIENRSSLKRTILTDLNSNYQPVYKEVSKLNDADIRIIKEVLDQMNKGYEREVFSKMLQKTAGAIAVKMEVMPQQNSLEFLNTVIKDYNALMANIS